ncbi:MAG TPA: alpha/beta hydrolase [Anaerolineales bacterium]|nr:alpha/beta hydrolase [Anaerolineales bacterium]
MTQRRKFPVWAVAAGVATAFVVAREAARRARNHTALSRAVRDDYASAFPVRRRFANIAGCNTHIYEAGPRDSDRPPLLLIHGGVIEGASWLDTVTALGTDRFVIAPDLPVHGASGYLPPHILLRWLEEVVESELPSARQFDLCGHSMGGGLALHYALRHSEKIRRLILCAPVSTGQIMPRIWPDLWNVGLFNLFPLHNTLIEKVWGDSAHITTSQREQFSIIFRDFFFSPRWWWYLTGGLFWVLDLPPEKLKSITSPALFIWGERDQVVPFRGERTIQYIQAIPNARLHFLRGLGHMPQVEAPDVFNAVIRDFVAT